MANRFLNNIRINDEYTLPATDGTENQIIVTDGAGNLSFNDLGTITGAVTGVESNLTYYEVKNSSGAQIIKGKGVMAVGTDGNSGHILIDEMVADGSVEARYFLGVLSETLDNGEIGRVIAFGELDQFNTTGQNGETWTNGQVLWCDPDSAGDFTTTEPDGPNVKIPAAFILKASTNGKIQIRVQANEAIHMLHDTKITTQADGELLVWNNTLGVWQNDGTATVDYTNGRVGIGTPSPSYKLDVSGNANDGIRLAANNALIGGGATGGDTQLLYWNGSVAYYGRNSLGGSVNQHEFRTSGATRVLINSSGNVGIGTTSPTAPLDTNGVRIGRDFSITNRGTVRIDSNGTSSPSDVLFGHTAAANQTSWSGVYWSLSSRGTSDSGKFQLWRGSGHASPYNSELRVITVMPSGDTGIGESDPSQKLHVGGNIRVTGAYYDSNNSPGTSGQVLSSTATGTDWVSLSEISGVDGTGTAGYVAKWSDTDTITNSVLYDDGADVGIGTTSPAPYIDGGYARGIQISNEGRAGIRFHDTGGVVQYFDVGINGGQAFISALYSQTPIIKYQAYSAHIFETDTNERMRIDSNGNIGIGTTIPSDGDLTINIPRLHVVGLQTSGAYHLAARFQAGSDSDNTGASILINHSNDRGLLIKAGRKDGNREVAYFDLVSSSGNITNMLTMGQFASNYNVGIGTTNPASKLQVAGGVSDGRRHSYSLGRQGRDTKI